MSILNNDDPTDMSEVLSAIEEDTESFHSDSETPGTNVIIGAVDKLYRDFHPSQNRAQISAAKDIK